MFPTEDCSHAVKDHIVLSTLLDVIKHDKKAVPADMKIPSLLTDQFERYEERAVKELYEVRQTLRRENAKILTHKKLKDQVEVEYLYCGYKHKMSMLGMFLKAEIQRKLMVWEGMSLM